MITYGFITISDKGSRGEREDGCKVVAENLLSDSYELKHYIIVPDEIEEIQKAITHCSDELKLDLVLTSGGTGFSVRDVTPEATLPLLEKHTPGISEAMRYKSLQITPKAMLSRAISGIRKQSLIINLPGSPKAVGECLEFIKEPVIHGIEILKGSAGECARQ
ncbi:MAG: MogA/MoaB family molybdenum cofactor biosynthesis protein [Proteocatella sp.]